LKDWKKIVRNIIDIKTICFAVLVSISLIYYSRCYIANKILIFDKNSSVVLLGLIIAMFWVIIMCLYLIYENRKLTIENQKLIYKILEKQEIQYHGILESESIIKELIIESNNSNVS